MSSFKRHANNPSDKPAFSFFKPAKSYVSNSQRLQASTDTQTLSLGEYVALHLQSLKEFARQPDKFGAWFTAQNNRLKDVSGESPEQFSEFKTLESEYIAARQEFITNRDESSSQDLTEQLFQCIQKLDEARQALSIKRPEEFDLPNPLMHAEVEQIEPSRFAVPTA